MLIDAITWTADPAIFSIFGREVRWYGLFFAVGFLVGYAIEERIYKHDNAPAGWCDKAFIYTIIATIIGARGSLPILRLGILLGSPVGHS